MPRFVVLFGPPGSGKGTQAARLKDALKVPHISTGDMFRDHKARQTPIGLQVESILAAGALVGDDITNAMVEERLEREDVAEGALLDGYPRNVPQAEVLDRLLAAHMRSVSEVVVIEANEEELIRRIVERGKASGRADDTEETARKRQEKYRDESEPCIGYYERTGRRVVRVDGIGSIDEVTARILAAVGGGGAPGETPVNSKATAKAASAAAPRATKAKVAKAKAPSTKVSKAKPKTAKAVKARVKKVQKATKASKKKVAKAKARPAKKPVKRR